MTTYSLRLRAGTIPLAAQALGVGAGVMYATIENGRVTAVNFGTLPSSTDDILYFDVTGYDPLPAVDDYFSDVCQTFSALPPVIPAGDLAPPYTPGGTPPTPGGPDYPNPELPPTDDPEPLANTAPSYLSFHADGVASVAVTGTGDLSEVSPLMRSIVRIQDICAVRLHAMVDTADVALELVLCFSVDDGTTWEELSPGKTGPAVTLGAVGAVAGSFVNVDPAVAGDTLLGICVRGTGSAVVGNIFATLFVKTSGGACIEIQEIAGCGLFGFPIAGTDFDYADYDAFVAALPLGVLFDTYDIPLTESPSTVEFLTDGFGKHLVLHHGFGGVNQNLYWTSALSSFSQAAAMMVTSLDLELAQSTGTGLILFSFINVAYVLEVILRNNRIYLVINGSAQDAGPASDICTGEPVQLIVTANVFSDGGLNSGSMNLFVDAPCENGTPTVYDTLSTSLVLGTVSTAFTQLRMNEWGGTERTGDQKVYLYAIGTSQADFND